MLLKDKSKFGFVYSPDQDRSRNNFVTQEFDLNYGLDGGFQSRNTQKAKNNSFINSNMTLKEFATTKPFKCRQPQMEMTYLSKNKRSANKLPAI